MSGMRALILAAGRGSRLGGLGETRPKCLVELAGRTLLDWQLDALRAAGIVEIGLIDGYRAEAIDRPGLHRFHNPRWAQTNMVASLACALGWLAEATTIVSYGDIVYHPQAIEALRGASGDIVVAGDLEWASLWESRFTDPLSDAENFRTEGDSLRAIGGRASSVSAIGAQYMGLVRWTPYGIAQLSATLQRLGPAAVDRLDMTGLLSTMLADGVSINWVPVHGGWCEVDSADDLALYERLAASGGWQHDWRWR
jgi:L-glutamine-phosphate cytidylyltransferase